MGLPTLSYILIEVLRSIVTTQFSRPYKTYPGIKARRRGCTRLVQGTRLYIKSVHSVIAYNPINSYIGIRASKGETIMIIISQYSHYSFRFTSYCCSWNKDVLLWIPSLSNSNEEEEKILTLYYRNCERTQLLFIGKRSCF